MQERYFEEFAPGQTFESGRIAIDAQQVIDFATRFDPQPFHTDPEAARGTMFGGLAASGWHTAAITMRLLVTSGIPLARWPVGSPKDPLLQRAAGFRADSPRIDPALCGCSTLPSRK